jgi:hypothetical protein
MVQANSQNERGSYGESSFKPFDLDIDTIEPDAYPGCYKATVDRVKTQMSSTDKPMIIVEWKITSTEDESAECQKSVGGSVADFITLAPDRSGNPGRLKLRTLRDQLELDPEVIPSQVTSLADFNDFAAAIKGKSLTIWVSSKTDADGNIRTNVHYTAPKTALAPMADDDEEEPAPQRTAVNRKPAPAKKPAAKTAGKRR